MNANTDTSPWLVTTQAAVYVAASPATIMRAARSGKLRGYKLSAGRVWRFRREDLDAWIQQTTEPVVFEARR